MKKYIYTLIVFAGLLSSCADKLDVKPTNTLYDEQIEEILASGDEEKIELIMSSLASGLDKAIQGGSSYSGFGGNAYNYPSMYEIFRSYAGNDVVLGDKSLSGSGTKDYQLLLDSYSADQGINYPIWWYSADMINRANKVLGYLTEDVVSTTASLKGYRAKCLFLRAWGYNYLMQYYADAPLSGGKNVLGMPLYTEYKVNTPVARSSSEDTYNLIKADLKEAITLFQESGKGTNGYTLNNFGDFDRGVAQFLLARVSLWTGDYDQVITSGQEIMTYYPNLIDKKYYGFQSQDALDSIANGSELWGRNNAFLYINVNPECILGYPQGDGAVTWRYSYCNPLGTGGTGGLGEYFFRIDDRLYNQMSDNDIRKGMFLTKSVTYTYPTTAQDQMTIPPYTNLKWGATVDASIEIGKTLTNSDKQTALVDEPILRSSEVLLMMAEAYAMKGDDSNAKSLLNKLLAARTKDGATTMTCDNTMSGKSTLDMVKMQWRIEMWGEGGLEFFNNKRWSNSVDRTGSTNHVTLGTLSWQRMTYEIPDKEMNTNPNCVQNTF